jgi:hypothetical protein
MGVRIKKVSCKVGRQRDNTENQRFMRSKRNDLGRVTDRALVRRHIQELIFRTFNVSEQEAADYARGLVIVAEGWGGEKAVESLDWEYRIKKSLGIGKKLAWRSEQERLGFEETQKQKYQAYEFYIAQKKV